MAGFNKGVLLPPYTYQANIWPPQGWDILREYHSAAVAPLGLVHGPRGPGEYAIILHSFSCSFTCLKSSDIPKTPEGIGPNAAIILFHFLNDCAPGSL